MTTQSTVPKQQPYVESSPSTHHWVPKALLVDAMVNGTKVVALCGCAFVPVSDQFTAGLGGKANVCSECEGIWKSLGK